MYKIKRKTANGEWEVFDSIFQGVTESYDFCESNKETFDDWLNNALDEDYEIEKVGKLEG